VFHDLRSLLQQVIS